MLIMGYEYLLKGSQNYTEGYEMDDVDKMSQGEKDLDLGESIGEDAVDNWRQLIVKYKFTEEQIGIDFQQWNINANDPME
jgi:hypothetical protein